MKQLTLSCLVILFLLGCTKETLNEQQPVSPDTIKHELTQYKAPYIIPEVRPRTSCYWTEIAAGSNNAITDAIDNACEGGIIYLKAGEHIHTEDIVITKSVKIIGESGAILKVTSSLLSVNEVGALVGIPDIHVLNAPSTLIQDLEIRPIEGDGGVAILLENSPYSAVIRSKIIDFEFSVAIHKSDFSTTMLNEIKATSAWQTGAAPTAHGINNINGKSAYIADNKVSNAVFGIFASDQYGTMERNTLSGCLAGAILCNVPMGIQLPSGEVIGSLIPATQWKVRNNISKNNLSYGILVIDGANNNLIENNDISNNGAYDIEITTDTERFGFLTPAGFENTVNVGSYPNITIKNCGPNNTINGGVLIDTSTDPCN